MLKSARVRGRFRKFLSNMWNMSPHEAEFVSEFSGYAIVVLSILSTLFAIAALRAGNIKEDSVKLKIAQANSAARIAEENAAVANSTAEGEKLARIKLEEKIAPCRLSGQQKAMLIVELSAFKGQKVRIESYSLDLEGQIFAEQIKEALDPEFRMENWIGSEMAGNGFAKGVKITGSDKRLVRVLAKNFRSAKLSNVSTTPLPPPNYNFLVAEPMREKDVDVSAVILVGVKPLP